MKKIFSKKIHIIIFINFLVAITLVLIIAPKAEASFLKDLWGKITSPFSSPLFNSVYPTRSPALETSVSGSQINEGPVYESKNSYEEAIVGAIKKASPAVVSVVISQYVSVVEQCPYNPFSNLPPEFQQFFGNQPQLYAPCDNGKKQLRETGGGTGFIISSNGLILTNKHVASDKNASYAVFLNDGRKFPAKILDQDPVQDLAVLKIEASNLPTVELGNSDSLELGQTAIAIGNALGEFRNTVSVGVISGLSRTITAQGADFGAETISNLIQTDAAINPGNSGGPLLNLAGQVIGIDVAMVSGAQNIGFAIPINQAKRDIDSVKRTGSIQTPYLGVRYVLVNSDLAQKQNLGVDYGALIKGSTSTPAVEPNSPASAIGLKSGDIILEVSGQKIDENHSLIDIINRHAVGDAVDLKIYRKGETLNFKATLARRPNL